MTRTWTPLAGPARRIALEVLLDGPISRAELARRVGLSAGSLTRLTKPLLESRLLVETSSVKASTVGRPSLPLDVDEDSHSFVGVKLTEHTAYGVLTTLRARVVHEVRLPIDDRSPSSVADVVSTVVRELEQHAPGDRSPTGIGVTLGGEVDDRDEVARAPFLGWIDVPFGDIVSARTGVPTVVENDVVGLTAATQWFGAGRGAHSFALLTIGAGIGFGLVANDRLVARPGTSTIGHHPLDPNGPLCPLGHRGCATAMLTIGSLTAQVGIPRSAPVGYDEAIALAESGDPIARQVFREAGRALGRLIATAASFTMAERIVVGGEGVPLAQLARDEVREGLQAGSAPEADLPELVLLGPGFTDWARGAAVVAIQTFVLGD